MSSSSSSENELLLPSDGLDVVTTKSYVDDSLESSSKLSFCGTGGKGMFIHLLAGKSGGLFIVLTISGLYLKHSYQKKKKKKF